ncbi:MAG: hypothetical protein ACRDRJ_54345, partial [Streptosporangiaceae bacterium]
AYDRGAGQAGWVADWLPGICADLYAAGCGGAARRLLELSWDRVRQDADTGLASSSPSYRDKRLGELGKPLTALLTAATAIGAASMMSVISGFLINLDGDPATALQLATLRAAADADLSADAARGQGGLGELAADCTARLRGRLDRPRREAGDWSIMPPAGGCTCELCGTLGDFLAATDRRTLEWPLAKQSRQHVHSRLDGAELPVTHMTKREGRPYILVLSKTDVLFTSEQEARERDETDLKWLANQWEGIAQPCPHHPKSIFDPVPRPGQGL